MKQEKAEAQGSCECWDCETQMDAERIWQDAYNIAYVGASNPRSVARTIAEHVNAVVSFRGTLRASLHPAIRAEVEHLMFLLGEGIGPKQDDLELVRIWGEMLLQRKDEGT